MQPAHRRGRIRLGGYARQQVVFRQLDELNRLLPGNGGETFQKLLKCAVAFEVVNQGLDGNTRPLEAGLAAEPVAIDPDEFAQHSLLFVSHASNSFKTSSGSREVYTTFAIEFEPLGEAPLNMSDGKHRTDPTPWRPK